MRPVSSYSPESKEGVDSEERKLIWGKPGRETARNLLVGESTGPAPKSFSEILPPTLITSPSSPPSPPTSQPRESSGDRLRRVVRSSALPKMQGVVQNVMRRSGTLRMRRQSNGPNEDNDKRSMMSEKGLLAKDTDSFVSEKDIKL